MYAASYFGQMKEHFLRVIEHMRWADARTAGSILQCPSAVPDAERLFAHIAAAEHLWYTRMLGRAAELAVWPALTADEARDVAARHASLLRDMIADLPEGGLRREIVYTNSAGRNFRNTVSDIVTHVGMHGERHRGQIARIVRAAGGEPPYTDFIEFARRDQ